MASRLSPLLVSLSACSAAVGADDDSAVDLHAQSPVAGVIEPCEFAEMDRVADTWLLDVPAGAYVVVSVDTVDAATAFDPALTVLSPSAPPVVMEEDPLADDEVACTFPPPDDDCPRWETQAWSGPAMIVVLPGTRICADPARGGYSLDVTIDGAPASLEPYGDDVDVVVPLE